MTKIVLYIATSKDGYIADEHGGVSWLPQTVEETGGQDYGYSEFYDSVDALAIGRKTYEQILALELGHIQENIPISLLDSISNLQTKILNLCQGISKDLFVSLNTEA